MGRLLSSRFCGKCIFLGYFSGHERRVARFGCVVKPIILKRTVEVRACGGLLCCCVAVDLLSSVEESGSRE